MVAVRFALALAAAYALALAFFPALAWPRRRRTAAWIVLSAGVALCPLVVAADTPFLRFLASVNATALLAKLYDLHVGAGRGHRPSSREFAAFLPNMASVVLRKLGDEPRPGPRGNLRHLAAGLAGLAAGGALLAGTFLVDWSGRPFLVEHCAKVLAFFLAVIPGSAAAVALWRLGGGRARDFMHNPFLARTPADFWRRYNRPAQQFFAEDVFRPAGGRRFPIRAALLTFAASALIHEYAFAPAVGRVQGYQTAFFLLQGCAVVATAQARPQGRAVPLWIAGTLAFNLMSSVLFFASVNGVVPFYSQPLPAWLRW